MAAGTKSCDGNCLGCSFQQQTYCSAQRTYALLKNEEALFSHIAGLEEAVTELRKAFDRFNGGGAPIINPFDEASASGEKAGEEEEKAQDGGGAENRPPQD